MKKLAAKISELLVKAAVSVIFIMAWAGMRVISLVRSIAGGVSRATAALLLPIPAKIVFPLFLVGGITAGLGLYTIYMSRAFSYLSDDPAACVNCHIMSSSYQSWSHSSHAQWATCNDCHVPQTSLAAGYAFKAVDGLYHAAMFTFRAEPQVIRPRHASNEVILENCIRCHTQLNTEFVKTGMVRYTDVKSGSQRACWDCHRDVPHTRISNLASAPNAIVPLPASPVPDWLKKMVE